MWIPLLPPNEALTIRTWPLQETKPQKHVSSYSLCHMYVNEATCMTLILTITYNLTNPPFVRNLNRQLVHMFNIEQGMHIDSGHNSGHIALSNETYTCVNMQISAASSTSAVDKILSLKNRGTKVQVIVTTVRRYAWMRKPFQPFVFRPGLSLTSGEAASESSRCRNPLRRPRHRRRHFSSHVAVPLVLLPEYRRLRHAVLRPRLRLQNARQSHRVCFGLWNFRALALHRHAGDGYDDCPSNLTMGHISCDGMVGDSYASLRFNTFGFSSNYLLLYIRGVKSLGSTRHPIR